MHEYPESHKQLDVASSHTPCPLHVVLLQNEQSLHSSTVAGGGTPVVASHAASANDVVLPSDALPTHVTLRVRLPPHDALHADQSDSEYCVTTHGRVLQLRDGGGTSSSLYPPQSIAGDDDNDPSATRRQLTDRVDTPPPQLALHAPHTSSTTHRYAHGHACVLHGNTVVAFVTPADTQ